MCAGVKLNLPNFLTMSRIGVIPIVLVLISLGYTQANVLAAFLFAAACITDFFDGYFARQWDQVSAFGRTLDPIADKLLVSLTLFMLVSLDRVDGVHVLPALVIMCREIMVSGLREYLASVHVRLPVSRGAKWKTALQMGAVGVLVLGDGMLSLLPDWLSVWVSGHILGLAMLWVSAALTIITAYAYAKVGFRHLET